MCRGVLPPPPVDCLSFGGNIIQCFEEGKYFFLLRYITVFVCKSFIIIFTLSCNDFNKLLCQFPPFLILYPFGTLLLSLLLRTSNLWKYSIRLKFLSTAFCLLENILHLVYFCRPIYHSNKNRTGVHIHRRIHVFKVEIFALKHILLYSLIFCWEDNVEILPNVMWLF